MRASHAHLDCVLQQGTNRISLHPAAPRAWPAQSGDTSSHPPMGIQERVMCFRATSAYKSRVRGLLGMQPPPPRRRPGSRLSGRSSKTQRSHQTLLFQAEQGRYWHTTSVTRMSSREVLAGFDSDDEEAYDAFKLRLQRRLDEIKDATPCERRFMFAWTAFCHINPVHADCQLPALCEVWVMMHALEQTGCWLGVGWSM